MKLHLRPAEDADKTRMNVMRKARELDIEGSVATVDMLRHKLVTEKKMEEDAAERICRELVSYIVTTATGRTKRGCTFCAACNLKFQGLAADGAKESLWNCFLGGIRLVNFVHDENIAEFPEDENLQARVVDMEDRMIVGMKSVLTLIDEIRVESVLMRRWYKEAASIRDDAGNLLVWEPDVAEA